MKRNRILACCILCIAGAAFASGVQSGTLTDADLKKICATIRNCSHRKTVAKRVQSAQPLQVAPQPPALSIEDAAELGARRALDAERAKQSMSATEIREAVREELDAESASTPSPPPESGITKDQADQIIRGLDKQNQLAAEQLKKMPGKFERGVSLMLQGITAGSTLKTAVDGPGHASVGSAAGVVPQVFDICDHGCTGTGTGTGNGGNGGTGNGGNGGTGNGGNGGNIGNSGKRY